MMRSRSTIADSARSLVLAASELGRGATYYERRGGEKNISSDYAAMLSCVANLTTRQSDAPANVFGFGGSLSNKGGRKRLDSPMRPD